MDKITESQKGEIMESLGFKGTLEDIKKVWSGYAKGWGDRWSPWRPSSGDIGVYQALAEEKLSGRVLLFGATPELRDLIAQNGGDIVLIDICPEMVGAATKFLNHSNPKNETWIIADWCEMPFSSDYFDLMIGDFMWWLLSVPRQKTLRDQIARILKPGGNFVSRIHFCDLARAGQNIEEIIKTNLLRLHHDNSNRPQLREMIIAKIVDATADFHAKRLNIKTAIPVFEKIISETSDEFLRGFIEELFSRCKNRTDWTAQTKDKRRNIRLFRRKTSLCRRKICLGL
ncbi:MAG: class I SAM-dependent methyltransferase [Parcubacteria group bacterium]|nr:class I SAM-dependent methyltransferase [Parcubacteria group bacterium]